MLDTNNSKLDQNKQKLEEISSKADQTNNKLDSLNESQKTTNNTLNEINNSQNTTNSKLDAVNNNIDSANKKIDQLNENAKDLKEGQKETNGLLKSIKSVLDDIKKFLTDESDLPEKEDLPERQIDKQSLTTSLFSASSQCPPDKTLYLMSVTYTYSYSDICYYLKMLGYLIMTFAYLWAARIVSNA